jgi:hypothetical protein
MTGSRQENQSRPSPNDINDSINSTQGINMNVPLHYSLYTEKVLSTVSVPL